MNEWRGEVSIGPATDGVGWFWRVETGGGWWVAGESASLAEAAKAVETVLVQLVELSPRATSLLTEIARAETGPG